MPTALDKPYTSTGLPPSQVSPQCVQAFDDYLGKRFIKFKRPSPDDYSLLKRPVMDVSKDKERALYKSVTLFPSSLLLSSRFNSCSIFVCVTFGVLCFTVGPLRLARLVLMNRAKHKERLDQPTKYTKRHRLKWDRVEKKRAVKAAEKVEAAEVEAASAAERLLMKAEDFESAGIRVVEVAVKEILSKLDRKFAWLQCLFLDNNIDKKPSNQNPTELKQWRVCNSIDYLLAHLDKGTKADHCLQCDRHDVELLDSIIKKGKVLDLEDIEKFFKYYGYEIDLCNHDPTQIVDGFFRFINSDIKSSYYHRGIVLGSFLVVGFVYKLLLLNGDTMDNDCNI